MSSIKKTNSRYYDFSKAKFEYELLNIIKKNKIGNYLEVTESLEQNGYPILERVYVVKTRNPYVSILIYSSIDRRTDRVRDIGSDAIRVVLVWKTKRGRFYKKLHKHLRIKTVFNNLEKTLIEGKKEAEGMNLKIWEFSEGIGIDYK